MDNITHSLTGILASKVQRINSRTAPTDELVTKRIHRILFWLMLIAVNIPDIDVLTGVLKDPILSAKAHRSLTHSLFFAPVFAYLIALPFQWLSRKREIPVQTKMLWLTAFLGILIHIFFDVITSYGTQIFYPFTTLRVSLDWMFIIDPYFTGILTLLLILATFWKSKKRAITLFSTGFTIVYLLVELVNHQLAHAKFEQAVSQQSNVTDIGILPQPLSVFRWHGIAQTEQGSIEGFFTLFDDSVRLYPQLQDNKPLANKALQSLEGKWYYEFARFPHVQVKDTDSNTTKVEIADLQFNVDPLLLKAFNINRGPSPFTMRFVYDSTGTLVRRDF